MIKEINLIKDFINKNIKNISVDELTSLENNGYVLLRRNKYFWKNYGIDIDVLKDRCEELINIEGENAGKDGKTKTSTAAEEGAYRLTNLLAKGDCFKNLFTVPDILCCTHRVLGDNFRLSSMDMRDPLKGMGHQGLHLDWGQRKSINDTFYQCSAFIMLDKVTINNGPLRVIPKSHQNLVDVKSSSAHSHKRTIEDNKSLDWLDRNESKLVTGNIGDIIILNSNTFHGGTNNISGDRRRVIFINYRNINLRTQLDQFDYIPKVLHENFSDFEKKILFLYPKPIYEKLKRLIYNYRDYKFISLLIKTYSLINKYIS